MKDDSNQKPQRGRVNYVWVMGGCYLLFTAFRLFQRLFSGESETAAVNILGGGLFVVVGVLMLHREWKAYQYGKQHIDDPSTWSDEPQELLEEDDQEAEDR